MASISAAGSATGFDATSAVMPAQAGGDRAREPASDDGFGAVMSGAIDSVSVTRRPAATRAGEDDGGRGKAADADGSTLPGMPPDEAAAGAADAERQEGATSAAGAPDATEGTSTSIESLLALDQDAAGSAMPVPAIPLQEMQHQSMPVGAGDAAHALDGALGASASGAGGLAGGGAAVDALAEMAGAATTGASLDGSALAGAATGVPASATLAAQAALAASDARNAASAADLAPAVGDDMLASRRLLPDASAQLASAALTPEMAGQVDDGSPLAAAGVNGQMPGADGLATDTGSGLLDAAVGGDALADARGARADRDDGAGSARVDGATTSVAGDARAAAQARTSTLGDLFARLQPDAVPEQLGQRMLWMQQAGVQLARLQVHPLELGPIDIALDQRDGVISVSMTAQHPATRELLESHLPRLREQLAQDGAQVGRFDILGGEAGSERERAARERGERAKQGGDAAEAVDAGPAIRLPVRAAGLFEAYA
jgi:flagellar hook-length control protein FliK